MADAIHADQAVSVVVNVGVGAYTGYLSQAIAGGIVRVMEVGPIAVVSGGQAIKRVVGVGDSHGRHPARLNRYETFTFLLRNELGWSDIKRMAIEKFAANSLPTTQIKPKGSIFKICFYCCENPFDRIKFIPFIKWNLKISNCPRLVRFN